MQSLRGNGTSKTLIDVPFANLSLRLHVQDVKHQETIVFPCKGNVRIISISIVFWSGLKKEAQMNVLLIEKNGFQKIDF